MKKYKIWISTIGDKGYWHVMNVAPENGEMFINSSANNNPTVTPPTELIFPENSQEAAFDFKKSSNLLDESLGITKAEANVEDPTPFTPITLEDAKVIAENYIKEGSDSFKRDLAHYYTKYDEQQWNANIPNNVMTGTPNEMDPNEFA